MLEKREIEDGLDFLIEGHLGFPVECTKPPWGVAAAELHDALRRALVRHGEPGARDDLRDALRRHAGAIATYVPPAGPTWLTAMLRLAWDHARDESQNATFGALSIAFDTLRGAGATRCFCDVDGIEGGAAIAIGDTHGTTDPAAAPAAGLTAAAAFAALSGGRSLFETFSEISTRLPATGARSPSAGAAVALWHTAESSLEIAHCGLVHVAVMRASGATELLPSAATVAGISDAVECASARLTMAAGDVLCVATDGLSRAADRQGKSLGAERLLEMTAACVRPGRDPALSLMSIVSGLQVRCDAEPLDVEGALLIAQVTSRTRGSRVTTPRSRPHR